MAVTSRSSLTGFPPIWTADEHGLLTLGGDLSPERILDAYRHGIFPWPLVEEGLEILAWWSPDPRAIFELDQFHVSRRLGRRIRRGEFQITVDANFAGVIAGCAERRRDGGTWITPSMVRAYQQLHQLGHAHSVEAWQAGELVGGVYGVALGGFFAAESMFHRRRDASKVALAHLVQRLRERGFDLLDIQMWTPHTGRLGAIEIPRREFLRRLERALKHPASFA